MRVNEGGHPVYLLSRLPLRTMEEKVVAAVDFKRKIASGILAPSPLCGDKRKLVGASAV